MVLPLPTSPCSRRCMVRGERRSLTMALKASSCSLAEPERQAAVDGAAQRVAEAVAVQAAAAAEGGADELQLELERTGTRRR